MKTFDFFALSYRKKYWKFCILIQYQENITANTETYVDVLEQIEICKILRKFNNYFINLIYYFWSAKCLIFLVFYFFYCLDREVGREKLLIKLDWEKYE